MAELQPHQHRVVQEKKELDDKIALLTSFMTENPIYQKLETDDRLLLIKQHEAMIEYSYILAARIGRF